jgi:uncharacterized protein
MPTLAVAAHALLILSVFALWLPFPAFGWLILFILSITLGLSSGVLALPALVPIFILGAACWLMAKWKIARFAVFIKLVLAGIIAVIAFGFGAHLFPGFAAYPVINSVVLSEGAAAYSKTLSFDKTIAGLLILGFLAPRLQSRDGWTAMFRQGAPYALLTIIVVVSAALVLGYIRFDPKWTAVFIPWLLFNFLTCVSEEAFFRGFIQSQLTTAFARIPRGEILALLVAAVLFGLAHIGGGAKYALVATLAGIGYGWVYYKTKRIEGAILTHLLLNSVHFSIFTYPYLAGQ